MAIEPTTRRVQLAILEQIGHDLSVNELAEWLGLNRRTVLRYRKTARVAAEGVRQFVGTLANGNGHNHNPKPALSDQEVVALALAVQASPVTGMTGWRETVETGLARLLECVSPEMRERLAARAEQYRREKKAVDPEQRVLQAALVAIANRMEKPE
ncbi:MAG: hypothetical protein WD894_12695 [Pirellulales bacterium]